MSTALAESNSSLTVARNGIQLNSLDDIWRFAQMVAKSGLAPKGLQTAEAITVAIQMGFEVGLSAMASLQNIAVINGRPSLWGDAQLAVVRATGELEEFAEWYEFAGSKLARNPDHFQDGVCCVCRVKRRGFELVEQSFSVADAKQAKLWSKAGPWTEYPARMLKFRARSFALRDSFGDALRGLLSAEEAMETTEIRTATGRDVTDGASTAQIAASNPLKKPTLAEPAPSPVEASNVIRPVATEEARGKNFVSEADERASLSFDIRETFKAAEMTLPRFEGLAKKAGYLGADEALAGGKMAIEKLRVLHEKRDEIVAVAKSNGSEGDLPPW